MTDEWVRYFSVTDPRRHQKGFTVYKVISTVYPRNSPEAKTEVIVWKRHKEFQRLYKDLKSRHEKLYLKGQFPFFSKPRLFGRFESDVIEERRLAAQALLDFTANHPPLFTSQSCVKFFEKSHKVLSDEVTKTVNQRLELSYDGEIDHIAPESSSPLSSTDTESTISITSSPSQEDIKLDSSLSQDNHSTMSFPSRKCPVHTEEKEEEKRIDDLVPKNDAIASKSMPCHENQAQRKTSVSYEKELVTEQLPASSSLSNSSLCNASKDSSNTADSVNQTSLEIDYITQAGYHISQAVEHETNSEYELAFSSYKAAISCLLSGVLEDSSEDRKSLVQRKTSQYLSRAEQIYHEHLARNHTTTRSIPEVADHHIQEKVGAHNFKSLEAPLTDLKLYKVLGVVSSVILALNTKNDTPYIVKVLHKSSCPVDRRTKSILPCNVPFMCRLHNFIENESAVFLILEQASGGRLWDHVSPYFEFHHNPENPRKTFADFLSGCAAESSKTDFINEQNYSLKEVLKQTVQETQPKPSKKLSEQSVLSQEKITLSPAKTSETRLKTQVECQSYGSIPDVVMKQDQTFLVDSSSNDTIEIPNVSINKDFDTADILKNSQKLLESVKITLSKSEASTKASHLTSLLPPGDKTLRSKEAKNRNHTVCSLSPSPTHAANKQKRNERVSSITRDCKRPVSRERKSSSSRNSRSRIRFSCDDMFEGRARALSRSLDREALQNVDPRIEQTRCLGLPIDTVRLWAAQLLLALDALHRWGVVIGDLRPENLLLGCGLNLVLTYQCQWICVDHVIHPEAIEQLYVAPEVSTFQVKTAAADWWSYGAILFELLTGETLYSCHPGGLHSYSNLHIPSMVSEEGASLLRQLLHFDAHSRLGVGPHGVARLKAHSFFRGLEWNKIFLMSASV